MLATRQQTWTVCAGAGCLARCERGISALVRHRRRAAPSPTPVPAPPTNQPQARDQWLRLKRGFGVARAPSPDVRGGHPCPPLSPRRYRFRPPGCAHRRGRLTEHGRPLACRAPQGTIEPHRAGEAGIGERLRSDEVPPRNDETFAGPADEPPTGSRPSGLSPILGPSVASGSPRGRLFRTSESRRIRASFDSCSRRR
jgi:hypothetical protein